ncbi:MAG: glycosyltransferase family 4 protein [Chloroflexi bacterium]|nr:glycosyltransferase family 4 protein [Chloroflexota bacterium]
MGRVAAAPADLPVRLYRDLPQERWLSMEIYADGLLAGLAELGGADLRVSAVVGPPLGASLSGGLGRGMTLLARAWLYPLRVRQRGGEINHILDQSYGHLVRRLHSERTVVTVHDLAPLACLGPGVGRGVGDRLWREALRGTLQAARLVADSQFTRAEIVRLTGYDEARIAVAPPAVEARFRPVADPAVLRAVASRYRLPPPPWLLHVGHTAQRKNLETLLRALALLPEPAPLVQVGGTLTAAQHALAERLGVGPRLHTLGIVPREDLPALYSLARALVFPSRYEGFGLPVLEAMACGTPVVCSGVASLPEVAGDAALLVDPDDCEALAAAVTQLFAPSDLGERLRLAGLARAAQFTWARCAAAVAEVYRDLWRELGPGQPATF